MAKPIAYTVGQAYLGFPDAPSAFTDTARDASLTALFQSAIEHCQSRIAYFDQMARRRSGAARSIRLSSLVLFALGTLAPVLASLFEKFVKPEPASACTSDFFKFIGCQIASLSSLPITEIGYVLLAIAGALVVFDRFFDSSGSWIRYRQAQARLEVLLATFRFNWATLVSQSGGTLANDTFVAPSLGSQCTALVSTFVTNVENLAKDETDAWAAKFQAQIDKYDSQIDARAASTGSPSPASSPTAAPAPASPTPDGGKTSATPRAEPQTIHVKIFVPDGENLEQGTLKLAVDGVDTPIDPSGYAELDLQASPASHHLVARATQGGKPVTGELTLAPTANQEGSVLVIRLA